MAKGQHMRGPLNGDRKVTLWLWSFPGANVRQSRSICFTYLYKMLLLCYFFQPGHKLHISYKDLYNLREG